MAGNGPERARGWVGVIWPLMERSTPLTMLLVLVCGGVIGYYLLGELTRLQAVNRELFEKLEAVHAAQLELALHCAAAGEGR